MEETKECNTTTYLAAVVADIAVRPSSVVRVERVHAFLSVAGCGSVVRPRTRTKQTSAIGGLMSGVGQRLLLRRAPWLV